MLNPDFRLGASVGLEAGSLAAARPLAAAAGAGTSGALYRELQAEVGRFIENGSEAAPASRPAVSASALDTLSPEAQWQQSTVEAQGREGRDTGPSGAEQRRFMEQFGPQAERAAQRLGVAPEVLVAQAALESGWGRQPIRRADGSDSHNLFALKAGASWGGEVAEVATTEYVQGQPRAERAAFRSYAGPAEAFDDFARLLLGNPRYQAALQAGGDAQAYGRALQRGGYATDPAYADKLARVAAQLARSRAAPTPD